MFGKFSLALALAFAAGIAQADTIVFSQGPGTYAYTVPATGTYLLQAVGAQGGTFINNGSGGLGADAEGVFALTAGQTLGIEIGAQGEVNTSSYSNGGGGSFIYVVNNNQLLVAGGGGGGYTESDVANGLNESDGQSASTSFSALTESGGNVSGVNGGDGSCCGFIGHPGPGGESFVDMNSTDGYLSDASISLSNAGGDGEVAIHQLSVTAPEPASITLLGFSLAALATRRRRVRGYPRFKTTART